MAIELDEAAAEVDSEDDEEISVAEYVALLDSSDASSRAAATESLAAIVGEAFGEDGAVLGTTLRESGIVARLARCVADTTAAEIRAHALFALSNLCSDAVDPRSSQTKALLLGIGLESSLMTCVGDGEEPSVLLVAAATLQNLCHDAAWAARIVAIGGETRLEALLAHADPRVVRYASGALKNLTLLAARTLGGSGPQLSEQASHAVRQREHEAKLEDFAVQRARRRLSSGVRAMDGPRRIGRLLSVPVDARGVAWLDALEACHMVLARRTAVLEAQHAQDGAITAELLTLHAHLTAAWEAYEATLGVPLEELPEGAEAAAASAATAATTAAAAARAAAAPAHAPAGAAAEIEEIEEIEEEAAARAARMEPPSPVRRTWMHVDGAVEEVLEELNTALEEQLPSAVLCDPLRLGQASATATTRRAAASVAAAAAPVKVAAFTTTAPTAPTASTASTASPGAAAAPAVASAVVASAAAPAVASAAASATAPAVASAVASAPAPAVASAVAPAPAAASTTTPAPHFTRTPANSAAAAPAAPPGATAQSNSSCPSISSVNQFRQSTAQSNPSRIEPPTEANRAAAEEWLGRAQQLHEAGDDVGALRHAEKSLRLCETASARGLIEHLRKYGPGSAAAAVVARVHATAEGDHHGVLEISHLASDADAKKAYKKLSLQLHPDRNHARNSEAAFKRLSEAYAAVTSASSHMPLVPTGGPTTSAAATETAPRPRWSASTATESAPTRPMRTPCPPTTRPPGTARATPAPSSGPHSLDANPVRRRRWEKALAWMMGGSSTKESPKPSPEMSSKCAVETPRQQVPRQPASTASQQRLPASLSPEELRELMTLQMLFMQGGASWPDEASRVRHDALNARYAAPTPDAPTRVAR